MTHIARASEFRQLREAREALFRPHPDQDRFELDFKVTFRCSNCGKVGYGPRRYLREAIAEHNQHCERRPRKQDDATPLTQLFYPRQ